MLILCLRSWASWCNFFLVFANWGPDERCICPTHPIDFYKIASRWIPLTFHEYNGILLTLYALYNWGADCTLGARTDSRGMGELCITCWRMDLLHHKFDHFFYSMCSSLEGRVFVLCPRFKGTYNRFLIHSLLRKHSLQLNFLFTSTIDIFSS